MKEFCTWMAMLLIGLLAIPVHAQTPIVQIRISEGRLRTSIEINDSELLEVFNVDNFQNGQQSEPVKLADTAYHIERMIEVPEIGPEPFDHLYYYPAQDEQAGWIFYAGQESGETIFDGMWFPVTSKTELILQEQLQPYLPPSPWRGILTTLVGVSGLGLTYWLVRNLRKSRAKQ